MLAAARSAIAIMRSRLFVLVLEILVLEILVLEDLRLKENSPSIVSTAGRLNGKYEFCILSQL